MSKLYVSEYSGPAGGLAGNAQVPVTPAIRTQVVDFSAGVAATALAFTDNTHLVRLHTDAICSFVFGVTPSALTTDGRLPADATEYFAVRTGDKVSAITNT